MGSSDGIRTTSIPQNPTRLQLRSSFPLWCQNIQRGFHCGHDLLSMFYRLKHKGQHSPAWNPGHPTPIMVVPWICMKTVGKSLALSLQTKNSVAKGQLFICTAPSTMGPQDPTLTVANELALHFIGLKFTCHQLSYTTPVRVWLLLDKL